MKIEDISIGDQVVYIPKHLLMGSKALMVKHENLGTVTSKNDLYVFVRYVGKSHSQATIEDLFTLRNRPDLIEKLNIEQETQVSDTTKNKGGDAGNIKI